MVSLLHNELHARAPDRYHKIRALRWALIYNAIFLIVEFVGGWISGSLALLADAGHMLSDVVALAAALWVAYISARPPSMSKTYGLGRLEVLSGLLNGLVLWGVVGFIMYAAFQRLGNPLPVDAKVMLPVAVLGLLANLGSAWMLSKHRHDDLNVRSAFLHLVADGAGSISVIAAGIAVLAGVGYWIDPVASILIGILILFSTWKLVSDSIQILLEGTSLKWNLQEIRNEIEQLPNVTGFHDLHVWQIASGEPMLTVHLICKAESEPHLILESALEVFRDRFGIEHCTVQIENSDRSNNS